MTSAKITEPAILLTINQLYRENMTDEQLYEATRGFWRVGLNRNNVKIAIAVHQGIVVEVYRIKHWQEAGTDKYKTRTDFDENSYKNRWEFKGEIAKDIRDKYVGKSVRHYLERQQNPVKYVNI